MDSLPSYRVERTREVTGGSAQMVQLRELFAPDRMAAEMKTHHAHHMDARPALCHGR